MLKFFLLNKYKYIHDGVGRVSGLHREPVVSVENPTLSPTSHFKKMIPTLFSWKTPTFVASSVRVFCARNSQQEGRSLPRKGRDHLFQWGVGISVGFSKETSGSLRNTETRRTPSYLS